MKSISGAYALELLTLGYTVWIDEQRSFKECHGEKIMELHHDTSCAAKVRHVIPKSDLKELLLHGLQLYQKNVVEE